MPSRKTILVIDDDSDILDAMQDTLGSEGYDTAVAGNGPAGLEYLRSHPAPGVILLDWNMAPMNGLAFMRELGRSAELSRIPVVLLTADMRVQGKIENGFAAYLAKPVDLEKLVSMVARYCE